MNEDDTNLIQWTYPPYIGGWKVGGSWTINVIKKPTDQQIKNTEELLGWKWVDALSTT